MTKTISEGGGHIIDRRKETLNKIHEFKLVYKMLGIYAPN